MERYRYSDYSDPTFVERLFQTHMDRKRCEIVLSDSIVQTTAQVAIMNFILWEPLIKYGIHPGKSEFLNVKSITTDSISAIHSKYYLMILLQRPDVDYMDVVADIFWNTNKLYNLTCRYLNAYIPTIDAIGLAKIVTHPKVKKLIDDRVDSNFGTRFAEQRIKAQTKELLDFLKTPADPEDNCLFLFMQAKTLKANQIPQMILRYGLRSDVDGTVCHHVINESSFSGLKSPEDFGVENLSGKKSAHLNRTGISISQYTNRKARLSTSQLVHLYPGSCGSNVTIPFVIKPEYAKNMTERTIIYEGKELMLTSENVSSFVGKTVQLRSVFGCKHTDGFCERCAGYRYYAPHVGLSKFVPPGIHIGLLCTSHLMSRLAQRLLSNKHLINTDTKVYTLPPLTARYLSNDNDSNLFWDPGFVKKLKNCQIRIPADSIGQITDLTLDVFPIPETYSKIAYVDIMKGDQVLETLYLETDGFVPFLSEYTLEYMRNQYDSIEYKDNGYVIDMKTFDTKEPFLSYVVMNDDMMACIKRIMNFIGTNVSGYTSVSKCLTDFADIVFHKTELNLFYLEVILRDLNIVNPDNFNIPNLSDVGNTEFQGDIEHTSFAKLDTMISRATLSMKFAHEKLTPFLTNPETYLHGRHPGLFKDFFGMTQ